MTRTRQPKTASRAGTGMPRQHSLTRPGWWLTFTDLMALMVASLVLLYAMGTPRIPPGFILPGVLDEAPDAASALPPVHRADAMSSQRAALAQAPLIQALSEIGLAGAVVRKIGTHRLLIRLSAEDIGRLLAQPVILRTLTTRILAAGWRPNELVLEVDGDPSAERLLAELADLSPLRALGAPSMTIRPTGSPARRSPPIRTLLVELAPMEGGSP